MDKKEITTTDIVENNKLIAEFMEFKLLSKLRPEFQIKADVWQIGVFENDWPFTPYSRSSFDKNYAIVFSLYFHSSWNWLMPVIEKIRELDCLVSIRFNRQMPTTTTTIANMNTKNKWSKDIECHGIGRESVYLAVIQFIKWYNNQ